MNRKKIIYLLPILLFAALMAVAAIPLLRGDDPADIRSALLEQSVPFFTRAEFSSNDLKGRVTLVNFFASWCPPCEAEHSLLMDLKTNHGISIYGVNYKDSDSGRVDYLQRLGNPYVAVTPDPKGEMAILWGTYGVPETFVIDKNGTIRYRLSAPLTPEEVKDTLIPMIREIQ
jgi:cytochrome c biogenesis protein CcmG/thiol:disulfide interchange protein DsbE